jgi:hypothetical protein
MFAEIQAAPHGAPLIADLIALLRAQAPLSVTVTNGARNEASGLNVTLNLWDCLAVMQEGAVRFFTLGPLVLEQGWLGSGRVVASKTGLSPLVITLFHELTHVLQYARSSQFLRCPFSVLSTSRVLGLYEFDTGAGEFEEAFSLAGAFPGGPPYASEVLFRAELGEPLRLAYCRSEGSSIHRLEDLIEYALSFITGQPLLAQVAVSRWLADLVGGLPDITASIGSASLWLNGTEMKFCLLHEIWALRARTSLPGTDMGFFFDDVDRDHVAELIGSRLDDSRVDRVGERVRNGAHRLHRLRGLPAEVPAGFEANLLAWGWLPAEIGPAFVGQNISLARLSTWEAGRMSIRQAELAGIPNDERLCVDLQTFVEHPELTSSDFLMHFLRSRA